jgi:hypothetical protein
MVLVTSMFVSYLCVFHLFFLDQNHLSSDWYIV